FKLPCSTAFWITSVATRPTSATSSSPQPFEPRRPSSIFRTGRTYSRLVGMRTESEAVGPLDPSPVASAGALTSGSSASVRAPAPYDTARPRWSQPRPQSTRAAGDESCRLIVLGLHAYGHDAAAVL